MTENPWPHDESLETPENPTQVPESRAEAFPPTGDRQLVADSSKEADPKSVVAKDAAEDVGRHAVDAAQNVADTAKDEAAHVAAEVKTNARELMAQTISDITEQTEIQQKKVAEGLRSISEELQSMAYASNQPGLATDLVRQAADRSASVASWLNDRDPSSLLTDVKSFARAKPGTFLLLAAGAGILAGRLARSLSAGAPQPAGQAAHPNDTASQETKTAMTVPAAPTAPPGSETSTAELPATRHSLRPGETGTYPTDQSGTEAQTGTDKPELWRAEPVVVNPLPAVDPLDDDPFSGGRR